MPNGKYSRDTFIGAQDDTQKGMLFDMIDGLYVKVDKICEQPDKCAELMDNKIKNNNKIHRRAIFGIAGGGGLSGAVILKYGWDFFKNLFST